MSTPKEDLTAYLSFVLRVVHKADYPNVEQMALELTRRFEALILEHMQTLSKEYDKKTSNVRELLKENLVEIAKIARTIDDKSFDK